MSTILPNEEKLLAYNGSKLILTNMRINIADRRLGDVNFFLENVRSVTTQHKGYKTMLIGGCTSLLAGGVLLATENTNLFQIFLIAGIIMLLFWWATKRSFISVESDKGIVSDVDVDIMTNEEIQSVIDDIEEARVNRVAELTKERTVVVKRQTINA
ncbi:hypothetical protein SAMN05421788_1011001 [Filimonas lacunae]|uniref:Uncharacterized protein n=1 Tax=Filimonas lacunae TaxID=477680 RepID=A0A173MPI7_9BACT|nr:hypothetical protein [Filimonas lacunae]BAV09562.1 hypothetical protein FLA_5613 [Filimonas lacunae]SIS75280.1 hypothetical protein SAMN05421788_1011001 [Filimonas lacunae]